MVYKMFTLKKNPENALKIPNISHNGNHINVNLHGAIK